jgi:hypothetical protein
MYNKEINMATVIEVANGLKELRERMVFIGGAVISLYTDDPAADEIRPTQDIDLTINLGNKYINIVEAERRLRELEFFPDPEGHSICSYKYKNIPVDIMPASDSPVGPSNSWYIPGFDHLQQHEISDGLFINILPAPYFLATKFEAFNQRGGGQDYYGSHDYEDIIYILDNRIHIVDEILKSDELVKNFLINELTKLSKHPQSHEILSMHISPYIREERFPMLNDKINRIIK